MGQKQELKDQKPESSVEHKINFCFNATSCIKAQKLQMAEGQVKGQGGCIVPPCHHPCSMQVLVVYVVTVGSSMVYMK
jgi:hypothetical protein